MDLCTGALLSRKRLFFWQFWSSFGPACRARVAPWWAAYLNTLVFLEKNGPAYLNTLVFLEKNGPAYLNTLVFLKKNGRQKGLLERIARKDCHKGLPERIARKDCQTGDRLET